MPMQCDVTRYLHGESEYEDDDEVLSAAMGSHLDVPDDALHDGRIAFRAERLSRKQESMGKEGDDQEDKVQRQCGIDHAAREQS